MLNCCDFSKVLEHRIPTSLFLSLMFNHLPIYLASIIFIFKKALTETKLHLAKKTFTTFVRLLSNPIILKCGANLDTYKLTKCHLILIQFNLSWMPSITRKVSRYNYAYASSHIF